MTNSLEPSSSFAGGDPTGRPAWTWRLEDSRGTEVTTEPGTTAAEAPGFTSQGDAESWIGEVWHDLLDEGVDQVSLFEAGRQVYGPMSLHPAG